MIIVYSSFFITDELKKAQQHLSLLKDQYVKLQLKHADLQRSYENLKAIQGGYDEDNKENNQLEHSLAAGLLKLTKTLYGKYILRYLEIYKNNELLGLFKKSL